MEKHIRAARKLAEAIIAAGYPTSDPRHKFMSKDAMIESTRQFIAHIDHATMDMRYLRGLMVNFQMLLALKPELAHLEVPSPHAINQVRDGAAAGIARIDAELPE